MTDGCGRGEVEAGAGAAVGFYPMGRNDQEGGCQGHQRSTRQQTEFFFLSVLFLPPLAYGRQGQGK